MTFAIAFLTLLADSVELFREAVEGLVLGCADTIILVRVFADLLAMPLLQNTRELPNLLTKIRIVLLIIFNMVHIIRRLRRVLIFISRRVLLFLLFHLKVDIIQFNFCRRVRTYFVQLDLQC